MKSLFPHLIVSLCVLVATLLLCLGLAAIIRLVQKRKATIEMPESVDTRQPGRRLIPRIDEYRSTVQVLTGCLSAGPVLLGAVYGAALLIEIARGERLEWASLVLMSLVVFALGLWKLIKTAKALQTLQSAFEGYEAVGRSLKLLNRDGHTIFHDFQTTGFRLDHIDVGPKGVFAIQTLNRRITGRGADADDARVLYDGRAIYFPKEKEFYSLDRAISQAELFSHWISQFTDQPVVARAVVAVPGWLVRRTSAEGPPVVNPKQMETLFEHIQPRPLSEPVIKTILARIDQEQRAAGNHKMDVSAQV